MPKTDVTDALRDKIRSELPEIEMLSDEDLKTKVVEAWAKAIAESSYSCIGDIPCYGAPERNKYEKAGQAHHLRAVALTALRIAEQTAEIYPDFTYDRDVVIAGGLCHDVGKPFEFDPENQKKWQANKRAAGWPPVRHPPYGVHICLSVGLPMEIAHIAGCHSAEGENVVRSHEANIVFFADKASWGVLGTAGLLSDWD